MATVTHIIRSHYDPAEREKLEQETGQLSEHESDPWQTESSFSAQRRIRAAPSFVPAEVRYDEWGLPLQSISGSSATSAEPAQPSSPTADWYRSLVSTAATNPREPSQPQPRPSSAPTTAEPPKPRKEIITKNNWFISRALRSEPLTKPSSPAPSLADILARDPPPLPTEERYTPPVWLAIGPSNKGFSMLQRSGWNEGEGLGAHVARPLDGEGSLLNGDQEEAKPLISRLASRVKLSSGKPGEAESSLQGSREVIDLTLSDSDSESDDGFEALHIAVPQRIQQTQPTGESSAPHTQKSLLTPLPTVLKADRLGIGLKAKTEGPYKQSKKRVTHNAAAMAAHIRAAEELRRKKAEVGRGKRGFAKVHKREEDRRKLMLAYLND
ncbi:hypothetical protein HYDPIDRAFT_28460 [Hydnomerulius pinastri MD-312]|uniref:G-patch domain-containing protein n=1 Tax=Hydnomerulius pinastri MD-312 TaxID=994086 RepID=A0A0C9W115_9AGAM|nr:hypothetical protein HYDPIDRAFT_28460 [Hydnomerulius pinastri MD-312]